MRVALVTGGTRGLGRAIALRLAQDAKLALLYHADAEAAAEAEATIPGAKAYRADIGDAEAVARTVEQIGTELGNVSILVNNAFRSGRTPVKTHELPTAAWDDDLRTNLSGHFYASRACLPSMVSEGFGRVVFIGSFAMRGEQGRVAYSVAKNGIVGLSNTIAQEYGKHGVTSNVVSPGFIEAGAFLRLSEEIQNRALKMVPSKRAGSPDNVAALVEHLCSAEGGYITGQVIGVDGGAR